jgi:multimeric flavodoxin WrbA
MSSGNKFFAVGIAGSPRHKGNSTSLLKSYLSGAAEVGFKTKIIYLDKLSYKGCIACDRCVKGKNCKIEDDLSKVFPLLQRADIWAMASPIYYDGVSGQLKTFFDRLRFTTYDPYKLKGPRRGIMIVTYEDNKTEFYLETATRLAKYLTWNNRGDFGKVKVIAESNLGPRDAWKQRPDLQVKLKKIGEEQAKELKELKTRFKPKEEA